MSEFTRSLSSHQLGRAPTLDGAQDPDDHPIGLVDTTVTPAESSSSLLNESEDPSRPGLARNTTRTSVRDKLARRKYAKWRQERFDIPDGDDDTDGRDIARPEENRESTTPGKGRPVEHVEHSESAAVDFGREPLSPEASRGNPGVKYKRKHHNYTDKPTGEAEVDILYENQRGSFFCGIPLYSHSSLLPFDHAAWATKSRKASPVNITNAQVPDPSWEWAWPHWYVDMTDDVDEDGWQYSFAFFGNFSWHGNHPWFHSFCRRRRWLRKRVKRAGAASGKPLPSSMSVAHHLNTDYFTIHSRRDRSPSFTESGPRIPRPDSYLSYRTDTTTREPPEEINDIPSLMKSLRLANVDREKIDAVRQFIELGGEELAFLKEKVPEIMHFLVFQNSRRQLLEFFRQQAHEAQKHRDEHDAEDRPESEQEARKINNLLKAVEAADEQIRGLEYWSDRKHVMVTTEQTTSLPENPLMTIFDKTTEVLRPTSEDDPAGGIRGIDAEKAGIGKETGSQAKYRGATLAVSEKEKGKEDKGKAPAKEGDKQGSDREDIERLPSRLERDQVAIPEIEEQAEDGRESEDDNDGDDNNKKGENGNEGTKRE